MKLADEFPKREVDQSAETARELSDQTGYSISHTMKLCAERVHAGEWEKVFKRIGPNLVPAYRRKKKK